MWGYIKWTVAIVALLAIVAVLHYYIPRREVVSVLANEIIRRDVEVTNAQGEVVTRTRDIRQIYAETPDGETMELDNVDAPVYLKFDSANLTAKAEQFVSEGRGNQPEARVWTVITYYGWRIEFLSWFPNAIDIRRAENGKDTELFPWHWLIIGIFLVGLLVLRRIVLIQIARFTDPVIAEREYDDDVRRGFFSRQLHKLGRGMSGRS